MRSVWIGFLLATAAFAGDEASQYSPHGAINRENVAKLRQVWIYRTGDPVTPLPDRSKRPAFEATPVYADGLLYIASPYGKVAALDPLTGKERWAFDAKIDRQGNYGDFANRGVSLWLDPEKEADAPCRRTVFFASVDARLFALDGKTGKPCTAFGKGGAVDLTKGLRRGPSYVGEYQVTSPPAVIDGLAIVGSAIADNNRVNAPTGEVRAFDARTGELRWSWDPLAASPDAGGANAWSRIRTDPKRHLVFIPTGSASPDYYGGLRPGENRDANSVVALHAKTGEVAWRFQTVHHDLWDYDVASPPTLFTHKRDGREVDALAVGSKTGHLFLLDRETGRPLFAVEERAVPKSDAPGETAARTQPYPAMPPALVPQTLSEEEAWGPTEEDRAWCQARIAELRSEGIFTPPSLKGSLLTPGNVGGLHWGGTAHDPKRGLLFAPVNNMSAIVRLAPREDVEEYRKSHPDWETTNQTGGPYAMSRTFLRSPSGLPCNRPPFGMLTAVDSGSGEIRWQVPLGVMPLPGAKPEWGSINLGGPLATGGGLVFIGASLDAALRAFDSDSGRELWKGELPASARATPMSFVGPDGKQYVVIAAGGHDTPFNEIDNAIVAFTLP
jgi:quinoprotein glucose dehydrogenase